jgi:hypothetical protein
MIANTVIIRQTMQAKMSTIGIGVGCLYFPLFCCVVFLITGLFIGATLLIQLVQRDAAGTIQGFPFSP